MEQPTSTSSSLGVETGLREGGLERAATAFTSLLAGDDPDSRDEREAVRSQGDEAHAEASEPTGDADDASDDDQAEDAAADEEPGDESDEAESSAGEKDDSEQDADPVYTVKVDGEEIEVALSELRNGYSRTQDYTRKTQELARERQALQQETAQLREMRDQYAQILPNLQQQVQQALGPEPDWDKLYNEDPIEYVRARQKWQEGREKLQAAQAEQQRLAEEQQREQQQHLRTYLEQQRAELPRAIPEWSDPETAKKESAALREYGTRQLGFTEAEINEIADHRAVVALRKAWLYDQMVARQQKAKRQGAAPRDSQRPVKPGSTARRLQQSPQDRAKKRLAQTGSVRDAAKYFETLF